MGALKDKHLITSIKRATCSSKPQEKIIAVKIVSELNNSQASNQNGSANVNIECDYCKKQYSSRGNLLRHISYASIANPDHGLALKYNCVYCGRKFASLKGRTHHIALEHESSKVVIKHASLEEKSLMKQIKAEKDFRHSR